MTCGGVGVCVIHHLARITLLARSIESGNYVTISRGNRKQCQRAANIRIETNPYGMYSRIASYTSLSVNMNPASLSSLNVRKIVATLPIGTFSCAETNNVAVANWKLLSCCCHRIISAFSLPWQWQSCRATVPFWRAITCYLQCEPNFVSFRTLLIEEGNC